jgi:iduronate 2-sulfatase
VNPISSARPTRRTLLAGGLSLPAFLYAQAKWRPNVLFIAVDDLKPNLGCYGNTRAKSPNIDRLAARGLVFSSNYCQQAVCSPSRTSLLTGRRPDTTGIYNLQDHFRGNIPDVVTLPEHFKRNGYVTTGMGKIFHGGLDDARSWTIPWWAPGIPSAWGSPENAERSARTEARLKQQGWRVEGPPPRDDEDRVRRGPSWKAEDKGDDELPDGQTAATAIRALGQLKGKPFFLGVGFIRPHLPFVAPKRYYDLYKDTKFPIADNQFAPKGAPPMAMHDSGELRSYLDMPKQGPIPEAKQRELLLGYHAALSYMDAQVGRVLDELDRLDLRRNTIVILWGDHGWHLGDHGLWNKHTNFEQATHAPMILSMPGQKTAGRKTAALTEFVDIYPTLSELCGLPAPEGVEGTSFAPLVAEPGRSWKKGAFSQYPRNIPGAGGGMGYSVRTERYRYTEWVVKGTKDVRGSELYDYQTDPQENVNLAVLPEHAALVKRMADLLHAGWRGARP